MHHDGVVLYTAPWRQRPYIMPAELMASNVDATAAIFAVVFITPHTDYLFDEHSHVQGVLNVLELCTFSTRTRSSALVFREDTI